MFADYEDDTLIIQERNDNEDQHYDECSNRYLQFYSQEDDNQRISDAQ